jgi:choline dehydrogenase-like flavoprotein
MENLRQFPRTNRKLGQILSVCNKNAAVYCGFPTYDQPVHIDLEEPAAGHSFHSTVCLIGGGIAGLILAMRLAKQGIQVHLLEAGGLDFEERSQALYRTEMSYQEHRGSNEGRARTFGGSSTLWGGQILPFTPDIFNPPDGSPSQKWPISAQDIAAYYEEVERILGVNSLPFTSDLLSTLRRKTLPASEDILVRFSKWAPFKRRNLAKTVGIEAMAHPGVTVFTHANVASLMTIAGKRHRIESARVRNYNHREFSLTADHFVVCAGTVESSRLLLCSPDIPNAHDQIGRYFHDHVAFIAAEFVSPGRERAIERLGPFYVDGTLHTCKFEASSGLRVREGLLATNGYILIDEPAESGASAVRNLLRSIQRGQLKQGIGANVAPMLFGAGDVARLFLYSRFAGRRAVSKRATLRLTIDVEQAPDPQNRIRVSDQKEDALGIRTAIVDWRINEPERSTAARYSRIIRKYLEYSQMNPSQWSQSDLEDIVPVMFDTNHAMGGLRMGTDALRSVVDRDLKVHGLDNLHVASCAVFPSGSSSNPTFTMMALTLRLADHLAAQIRRLPGGGWAGAADAAEWNSPCLEGHSMSQPQ